MNTGHSDSTLAHIMQGLGKNAKSAANVLRLANAEIRSRAILAMAKHIHSAQETILDANVKDISAAQQKGLSGAMLDRLVLNPERIEAMINSLTDIAALPDPIGATDEKWTQPNGLTITKVRTPIGVIGMIYESRPNVTADAAALTIKSGNACILRGGSEALHSNTAIHAAIEAALKEVNLPAPCVQYVKTTNRDAVGLMLAGLGGTIDLIIPRGGKNLVARVQQDARVPVLAHLEGRNHTYIHAEADPDMARDVLLNAKMRRTGICGATETLLLDEACADMLPALASTLEKAGCVLRGDSRAQALVPSIEAASETDFATEYLDAILNVKIVSGIDTALAHIARYGSGHTEAVITEDKDIAHRFLTEVDAAIVMHNTSTQFADGGEFGFGAEIGIATGKMHARGPVGAQHLTSYKYHVSSDGRTRS